MLLNKFKPLLQKKRNSRRVKGASLAGRALLFGLLSGEPRFKTLGKAGNVTNYCAATSFTIDDPDCFEFTNGIDKDWESLPAIS